MATTYFTYSKGEIWSKSLNACVCTSEAGQIGGRVVGLEDEWNDIRNATDKKAHDSLEDAQHYAELMNNHAYDILMECHEQNPE